MGFMKKRRKRPHGNGPGTHIRVSPAAHLQLKAMALDSGVSVPRIIDDLLGISDGTFNPRYGMERE